MSLELNVAFSLILKICVLWIQEIAFPKYELFFFHSSLSVKAWKDFRKLQWMW